MKRRRMSGAKARLAQLRAERDAVDRRIQRVEAEIRRAGMLPEAEDGLAEAEIQSEKPESEAARRRRRKRDG